jgi:DNA helicase-2/ATP-dependent DNA helicase PcrA
MQELYLTYAESRRLHGQDSYNRPSRFLLEIPQDLLSEVRMKASTQGLFGSGYASTSGGGYEAEANGMRMGQRVLHGKYGEGVVLQFEGTGERAKVQVNFAEGAKWLMVGYANLQVMD